MLVLFDLLRVILVDSGMSAACPVGVKLRSPGAQPGGRLCPQEPTLSGGLSGPKSAGGTRRRIRSFAEAAFLCDIRHRA